MFLFLQYFVSTRKEIRYEIVVAYTFAKVIIINDKYSNKVLYYFIVIDLVDFVFPIFSFKPGRKLDISL